MFRQLFLSSRERRNHQCHQAQGAGCRNERGANGRSCKRGAHKSCNVGGPAAKGMSARLIGILGVGATLPSVGVALGALTLARTRNAMQRLADMDSRLATCPARETPRGCPGVAMCIAGS